MKTTMRLMVIAVCIALGSSALLSCSSSMKVGQQKYAKLREKWTFENSFPDVWSGIERTVSGYHVSERNPKEVNSVEMRKITERTLKTDWIFSESRDKFVEFKVNGFPKKKYLQTRLKYEIKASKVLGGTEVAVETSEEIENLDKNGEPTGWSTPDEVDTSRPNELLEKIKIAILAAPNTTNPGEL